jgi:ABC-type antimicrobial peptide transport system permease subunit
MMANSILQGSLVIADKAFVERFPSASGNRMFLVDAPAPRADAIAKALSAALQSRGLEIVPAWQRLAEFAAVESSYISIFQALGGLGLLVGSAGLGIVVMRNVLERRSELALLQAVGFSRRAIRWLVVSEHWVLIALGVGIGGIAAMVAVIPSILAPGLHASPVGPAVTLGALALGGGIWSWLAAWIALRGPLLEALRSE